MEESNNFKTPPLNSPKVNDFSSKANTTSKDLNKPIKIILFPPKNKEFRYDSQSDSFEIHSVELSSTKKAQCIQDSEFNENKENSELIGSECGLTPLVETCSILPKTPVEFSETVTLIATNYECVNAKVKEIYKIEKVFKNTKLGSKCFLKGCKWSPDGLCLLSNSDDNVLRLFEITDNTVKTPNSDLQPVFEVKEGGTIYDFEWYPLMNSSNPLSCVFVSAGKDAPIHLWDAYTGQLRATYQPVNQFDEVTAAYSVAFSPNGTRLYSGYKKFIRVFHTSLPGRISEERPLKIKGNMIFQSNIASCISINPAMPGLYAVGCYDKTIGLYCEPEGQLLFTLKGHSGGLTQLKFSSDGYHLFSGGRKDPEILCWDIRNPGKVVYSLMRRVDTQQKIQFDVSPKETFLITGSTDGYLKMYNLKKSPDDNNLLHPIETWKGHDDCVNGSQFHPALSLIASASGQRHFETDTNSDKDDDDEDSHDDDNEREGNSLKENDNKTATPSESNSTKIENSLKIWSYDFDK